MAKKPFHTVFVRWHRAFLTKVAHIDKNAVRAAYNRADYMEQRKEMMQWYSDY